MSHKCDISSKARQNGHRVSHANNKTHHVFLANLQTRRLYVPSEKKYVRVKISTRMIRTIDKIGLEAALKKHGMTVAELLA
jgi:large subunit ribosomal protein L28